MYEGLHCPGIVDTDWRSMNSTILVSRVYFLTIDLCHVRVNCVCAEQQALEKEPHFDRADLAKPKKFKLAVITDNQNGQYSRKFG